MGLLPPQTGKIIPGSGCEARRRRQLGGAGEGRRGAALLASAFGAAAESGGGRGAERRCASEPGHAVVPPRRVDARTGRERREQRRRHGGREFPGVRDPSLPPSQHPSASRPPPPFLPKRRATSLRAATLSPRSPGPRRRRQTPTLSAKKSKKQSQRARFLVFFPAPFPTAGFSPSLHHPQPELLNTRQSR